MMNAALTYSVSLLFAGIALAAPQDQIRSNEEPSWSSWRGPLGSGVSPSGNPPIEWSEEQNIRWKTAIPGLGISSPIIWKDRIYVTTAIETDREGTPPQVARASARGRGAGRGMRRRGRRSGGGRFGGGRAGPTMVYQFVVLALDRSDGSIVWRTTVREAAPHEPDVSAKHI